MAAIWEAWTVNTLAVHLRGELNVDPDAGGSDGPDRVLTLARECIPLLWHMQDWRFRAKKGMLTTSDGTTAYTAPTDFSKLDQRWLRDRSETSQPLQFTEDVVEYQKIADGYESTDTGTPRRAVVYWDSTTELWKFEVAPPPDAVYVYAYWYMTNDLWTVGTVDDDDTKVKWPSHFNEGWRLLAKMKVLHAFKKGDEWKEAWGAFKAWLGAHMEQTDETITDPNEYIPDGYNDLAFMTSQGANVNLWP